MNNDPLKYDGLIQFCFITVLACILLPAYLAPTVLAYKNRSRHLVLVFVINLFFGLSVVGWVLAMALAADNGR